VNRFTERINVVAPWGLNEENVGIKGKQTDAKGKKVYGKVNQ